MRIKSLFLEHPATVGESYGEHFGQASGFAWKLFVASLACFIHGLIPALFDGVGSRAVSDLHHRMVTHRTSKSPSKSQSPNSASVPPASPHRQSEHVIE